MTLETLTEEDLDWLTRTENRLARMRQRETQHRGPKAMLTKDITDAIKRVRNLRIMLQARFGKTVDDYI